MGIYVEILIRTAMDEVWQRTQDPALHERWDLRFTSITYLPRLDNAPQRFLYTTRIGFGLGISGEGESTTNSDAETGQRTSSLKFWSNQRRSLIREGSGYWKYCPTDEGTRFLTWYDYTPRFGALGRLLDRVLFRPMLGWATAWSFDRLRLWIERGIAPSASLRQAAAHAAARGSLAFIFAYHGLVPKLLARDPDETSMLIDAGVSSTLADSLVTAGGLAELLLALLLVLCRRQKCPPLICLAAMPIATIMVAAFSPRFLTAAFNPITLNLSVMSLACLDLLTLKDLPSAGRTLRTPLS